MKDNISMITQDNLENQKKANQNNKRQEAENVKLQEMVTAFLARNDSGVEADTFEKLKRVEKELELERAKSLKKVCLIKTGSFCT